MFFALSLSLSACKKQPFTAITTVETFLEDGLDCHWSPNPNGMIVYSTKGSDSYYDVHISLPDGSDKFCISCDKAELPNRHISNPAWHPSGKWVVMVVEKATHPGSSTDALPGFGAYCDIWIANTQGTRFFKIVDIPNDYDHGVIAPRFSPDGTKLCWTHRVKQPNLLVPKQNAGYWVINVADFSFGTDSIPVVQNIHSIKPGEDAFYEAYGFSPDGNRIIFCSCMNQFSFLDEHIYTMNLDGSDVKKLTEKDYNEHGFYTPDGQRIVYMSSTESSAKGTDWWIMNTDGSNKKRLTYFNESNSNQYTGGAVWAGLGSFDSTGTRFVGGVQKSLTTQEGRIVLVDLNGE